MLPRFRTYIPLPITHHRAQRARLNFLCLFVANRVPIPGDPEGENDPISAFTLQPSSFSRVARRGGKIEPPCFYDAKAAVYDFVGVTLSRRDAVACTILIRPR